MNAFIVVVLILTSLVAFSVLRRRRVKVNMKWWGLAFSLEAQDDGDEDDQTQKRLERRRP